MLLGRAELLQARIGIGKGSDPLFQDDRRVDDRRAQDLQDGPEEGLVKPAGRIAELAIGLFDGALEIPIQLGAGRRAHRIEDVGDDVVAVISGRIEEDAAVLLDDRERRLEGKEIGLRPRALSVGDGVHCRDEPAYEIPALQPLDEDRVGGQVSGRLADNLIALVQGDVDPGPSPGPFGWLVGPAYLFRGHGLG